MTPEKPELDFILIRQKDYILNLISKHRYLEARACLVTVCELWTNNDYLYKHNELMNLIREAKT